jgi:CBS domain-containing protein
MKVQDIMTKDPSRVSPDATVREAAQIMKRENVGIVPVVDRKDNRLIGVVTDRDIAIRCVAEGRDGGSCRVQEVMSSDRLHTCGPDDDVENVMEAMGKEQVRRIPIVDERGSLLGIVAQADIVREANDERAEQTVERISRPSQKHAQ